MNRPPISLDPRLSALADAVGVCDTYADIGCDHGRLGAYLLKSGRVKRAVLTDISGESLQKARRLIGVLNLEDRVDFRVGDGADALIGPVQAAVIAGMGGTLIADIVRRGREHLGEARLILQPNVAACELRQMLMTHAYGIQDERIVLDGRRHYVIIVARPGKSHYDEEELMVGPVLNRTRPPELASYAAFRLRVAHKALAGAQKGQDLAQISSLTREIEIWRPYV